MSDSDFLLSVLERGGWHSRDEILAESFRERGCGLTVHSRAADLRARGRVVEVEVRASFYRLGVLADAPGESDASASASIPAAVPSAHDRGGALALFDLPAKGAYDR